MLAYVVNNEGMLNVFMPYNRQIYWFQAFQGVRNVGVSGPQQGLRHPLEVWVDDNGAYDFVRIVEQMRASSFPETYKRRRSEAITHAERMFLPWWDSVTIDA